MHLSSNLPAFSITNRGLLPRFDIGHKRLTSGSERQPVIKVHILYPNTPGVRFDMQYYCEKHMPMVRARLGAACTGFTVEAGLAGGGPGQPAPYVAIGALHCTSVEAFQTAMGAHAADILGDIPNYTDAQPLLQISETKVG